MTDHPHNHPPEIVTGADATFRVDAPANHPRPQSQESSLKKRLLGHNKWQLIISLAVVGIAISVGMTIAFQAIQPEPSGSNGVSPAAQPTPTLTRDEGDNDFFAKLPLSMLYYSFSQTTNNKNVFQASPNQQDNRFINIGFPERYDFLTSPNGRYLLRWNETQLEMSDYQAPSSFSLIYATGTSSTRIDSVVWHPQSSQILVATSSNEADAKTLTNSVFLVKPTQDKTEPTVVLTRSESDYRIKLWGYSGDEAVYFTQNKDGLQSMMTLYNIKAKKIERELPQLHQRGLLNKLRFDRTMTWGYWTDQNNLKRLHLQSGKEESIYQIDRSCDFRPDNNSQVSWAAPAPRGGYVVALAKLDSCSGGATSGETVNQLIIVDVSSKKILRQSTNIAIEAVSSHAWSPDESLVWLQADSQNAYVFNPVSMSLNQVPPAEQQIVTKERLLFLGWMAGKD